MVEDLHSANGSTLNGRPLLGGAKKLADGDILMVGEIQARFFIGDGPLLDLPEDTGPKPARDPDT